MIKTRSRGFTLVELLVAIAIIAALVGTSAVMAPKILKKGQQTKMVANMRQMASAFTAYTIEHSNRLPPAVTPAEESEVRVETYWFMYLEQQLTGGSLEKFTKDAYWKSKNQSIFVNSMHPKKSLGKKSPGYGINLLLPVNIAESRGDTVLIEDAPFAAVNMALVRDPERTPIVMPHWEFAYKCDRVEASSKLFAPYTVNNRLPVLFLDGHTETMTPKEYVARKLDRAPRKDGVE